VEGERKRRGRRRDRDRRILDEMQTFANYWELCHLSAIEMLLNFHFHYSEWKMAQKMA